jgi:hypothetical protein
MMAKENSVRVCVFWRLAKLIMAGKVRVASLTVVAAMIIVG